MWPVYLALMTVVPAGRSFTLLHPVATQLGCRTMSQFGQQRVRQNIVDFRSFENAHVLHTFSATKQPEVDNEIDEDDSNDNFDIETAADRDTATQQEKPSIKRRRRRRKEDDNFTETSNSLDVIAAVTTAPIKDVVTIPIIDVRRLVDTGSTAVVEETPQRQQPNLSLQSKGSETSTSAATTTTYDPLEQLLIDAKEMRSMSRTSAPMDGTDLGPLETAQKRNNNGNEVSSSNFSISKVLSTIVIVDFFVVLVFFLWFLLGIVASYTIKNDAIQIAFNSNFQTFVQPALGILMIASISDAVFKETEE